MSNLRLKLSAAAVVSVLMLIGCATTPQTEYVEVKIKCVIPPDPVLPIVSWDDLNLPFDYLPPAESKRYDDALTNLELYESNLSASFVEHRAITHEVCKP